jgi:hypothetical protein
MGTPGKQQTEDLLLELGSWTDGVVNARPGKDISKTSLQDAVNVDLSELGSAQRRKGSTRVIPGVDCHSLGSDADSMYFVDGSDLKKASKNGSFAVSVLRGGMTPDAPLWWAESQGQSWFSNGTESGRISGGELLAFSVEAPAGQPSVEALPTGGNLPAGFYGVGVCFVTASGEESGSPARTTAEVPRLRNAEGMDLPASGRLVLSDIPQPLSDDIEYIRIYVTDANGTVLYKYADMPVGTEMSVLSRSKTKGMPMTNEVMDEFPACSHLHAWRGYMLGARGKLLYHSEPQRFGLCQLDANYMMFSAPITMIAPVDDGFYVVSDRTYFISGGTPAEWSKREVLPYGGAAEGTYVKSSTKNECYWWMNGEISARSGGQIKNETIDKIAPRKFSKGAAMLRREDGIEQIVNTFPEEGGVEVMTATSFVEATITRAKQS